MRRLLGTLLLLGCGGASAGVVSSGVPPTRAPSPPSATSPIAAPSRMPLPEGMAGGDARAICAALQAASTEQDLTAAGLLAASWLVVSGDGASCIRGPFNDFLEDFGQDDCSALVCDDALTRCVDAPSNTVFVLRPGTRGPYLYAIVTYESTPPAVETGVRADALAHRDEICELLDLVVSDSPPIDPRGLAIGAPPRLVCGRTALAGELDLDCTSAFDVRTGRPAETASCRATCLREPADCGIARILARRAESGALTIYGDLTIDPYDEASDDERAMSTQASALLAAHSCGEDAGTTAGSRARRALCETLQFMALFAPDDDDGDASAANAFPMSLASSVLSIRAADTRESYCGDGLSFAVNPDHICEALRCDDAGLRCVDDENAYLLRQAPSGPELFAVVQYGTPPPATDEGRVAYVIAHRDRVCELFEMVRSRSLRVDPRGFARHRDASIERSCGAEAQTWVGAAADLVDEDRAITCSQSDCSAIGNAYAGRLFAHRAADETLLVYGWASPSGDAAALSAELDQHRCRP